MRSEKGITATWVFREKGREAKGMTGLILMPNPLVFREPAAN